MTENPSLAPCVAIVGPANSGKSTLLHLLDSALMQHPSGPLPYVVKGSPDGSGRYLFHAPVMRENVKDRVKGTWSESTIETVCGWIENARRHLDLVLVDFGGKHNPDNDRMLGRCTHFLVVARPTDDPVEEAREGAESWIRVCAKNGLVMLKRVVSLWRGGEANFDATDPRCSFRADASTPGDRLNRPVIEGLVDALLALRSPHARKDYFDLRLDRDWTLNDGPDLAGLAPKLMDAIGDSRIVLGGRAPIWAYARALRLIDERRQEVEVHTFDPKVPSGLVRIPNETQVAVDCPLATSLGAKWLEGGILDLRIKTPNRFLPPGSSEQLDLLPGPSGVDSGDEAILCGAMPIWIHLAYSRWLHRLDASRRVGLYDVRQRAAIFITGEPWHKPLSIDDSELITSAAADA